jgi:hypothetical protein
VEFPQQDELIRGGFAWHAWLFLKHESLTRHLSPFDRYEATATICVLQSMLTNYFELAEHLGQERSSALSAVDSFVDSLLSSPEVDVTSRFPDEENVTAEALIRHLRHALSHPRMRNTDPPTTGYTTIEDGSGRILRMKFTQSPDLNSKGEQVKRKSGEPRVFTIEIPVSLLTALALEVAQALAQPAMDHCESVELVPIAL